MPRPESQLWKAFKGAVHGVDPRAHLVRVENSILEGHSDVDYCIQGAGGVVELKRLPAWPRRPATPVRFRHYTRQQKNFLAARWGAGGRAWLLAQVADEYLLIPMPRAYIVGELPAEDLRAVAAGHWRRRIDGDELVRLLRDYPAC